MSGEYVEIPSDRTAKITTKHGELILYYDDEKDEVVIQATANSNLHVLPRASNSVALALLRAGRTSESNR